MVKKFSKISKIKSHKAMLLQMNHFFTSYAMSRSIVIQLCVWTPTCDILSKSGLSSIMNA